MRYLVVGLGNIGRKRRDVLGARCVATVDPVNRAADYQAPEACPPERYDAVVLAVPNQDKIGLLEQFLKGGKRVLVEKPLLFPDRAAAERMDRLAREHGAMWYTAYNHRFEPLVLALKRHLEAYAIGPVYRGRLFYGNGTVADVVGTWRDEGLGVLEDLVPHLLDLAGYLLGCVGSDFVTWALARHEAKSFDHCVLATADRRFVLEASFLSWRNTFAIELVGQRGSLHLHGLTKWGPSELIIRERVLPSGVPGERRQTAEGPDPTWARELEYFERLAQHGSSSTENDWWISRSILRAAVAA